MPALFSAADFCWSIGDGGISGGTAQAALTVHGDFFRVFLLSREQQGRCMADIALVNVETVVAPGDAGSVGILPLTMQYSPLVFDDIVYLGPYAMGKWRLRSTDDGDFRSSDFFCSFGLRLMALVPGKKLLPRERVYSAFFAEYTSDREFRLGFSLDVGFTLLTL